VAAGGRLAWLPQATIVFDEARFERRTEVTLDANSSFLAAEALLFGRLAMGEDVHRGACRDVWRVRRAGSLVFADTLLLEGAIADTLDHKATLDGARAAGFVLYVAPDAADRVENVRAALHGAGSVGGASAWNGLLVARAVARDGHTLLADLARLVELLSGRPLPRVCQC
jgi:urease accessory protein